MRALWLLPALGTCLVVACGSGEQSQFNPGDDDDPVASSSSSSGTGITDTRDGGQRPDEDGSVEVDCDANPAECLPPAVCGDEKAGLGESCDDGNTTAGDGCSPTCQIEAPYWACGFGVACVDVRDCAALIDAGIATDDAGCVAPPKTPVCGDGELDPGELCDDHNANGGDGCAFDCSTTEPDFICSTPGQPCVSTVKCGDGRITGSETCDDGNVVALDGCDASCHGEAGWLCAIPGTACGAAQCGDGIQAGVEECDQGTKTDYGCDASCKLQSKTTVTDPSSAGTGGTLIEHYKCEYPDPNAPSAQNCTKTTCGDGNREGTEQCDDNNKRPFDGCTPNCMLEPVCTTGTCASKCGDGFLFDYDGPDADALPDEECDDGNKTPGDGCSATCTVEDGFACSTEIAAPPAFIDAPVVFRDFNYWNDSVVARRHPDFQRYKCNVASKGLVSPTLDAVSGWPLLLTGNRADNGGLDGNNQPRCTIPQITSADSFSDWYRDIQVNGVQRGVRVDGISIRLTESGGSYGFDSAVGQPWTARGGFYPINGKGWANGGATTIKNGDFTTELRYAFTYDAAATPPKLDFSGDDDVWVFVNGHLALDIGGLHSKVSDTFTLTPALAESFDLQDKHMYEIALFHAEREDSASNFKLTLRGFQKRTSVCHSICGDGIQSRDEQCDLGDDVTGPPGANSPGAASYGGCSSTCKLGAYCGDKTTQNPPETCDDGVNLTSWTDTASSNACGPSCTKPDYCGDGLVQGTFGERCDNGNANTSDPNAYGNCTATCQPGPRCGDFIVQANGGEVCDNGFNVSTYVAHPTADDCSPQCKAPKFCGDGTVDFPFEQCDKGNANTDNGSYDSCTVSCKLGPRCGDGVKQGPEQCDDGNRTSGDGCSASCTNEQSGPH